MFRDPEGKLSAVRVLFFAWAATLFVFWVYACVESRPFKLVDVPPFVVQLLIALAAVRGVQIVGERFGRRGP